MFDFLEGIFLFLKGVISSLGYWGIGGGMFLESACIPIPSELVLPLAGFMVADGKMTILTANIVVATASMLGSLLAYIVGYYGGRAFILKYGKYFFVSADHFYKAEKTFNRFGGAAVFFGRLLPIIRTFISLPAGIARMDIKKFLGFSLIGMLPWNFILIFLGYKFGQQYDTVVRPIFKRFEHIVAIVLILIIILFVAHLIYKKVKNRSKSAA